MSEEELRRLGHAREQQQDTLASMYNAASPADREAVTAQKQRPVSTSERELRRAAAEKDQAQFENDKLKDIVRGMQAATQYASLRFHPCCPSETVLVVRSMVNENKLLKSAAER